MGIIREMKQNTKDYGMPTLALITITIVKLYLVGAIEVLYLYARDMPIYMENTPLEWWKLFIILLLDMVVGAVYVWIKRINKGSEGEEDKDTDEEGVLDEGVKRGFNYIWMSGVSSILVTLIWSLVVVMITVGFEGIIVRVPNATLTLYIVLGFMQILITYIIKRGILVYTVFSTVSESNGLKALKFSFKKVFRLVLIDILFYVMALLGALALGIGVFITVPTALHNQSERWESLMRDFEREELYGTIHK